MSEAQLHGYLAQFAARLRRLIWLRGGAFVLAVGLLVTLGGAWLAIRTGFASGTLLAARLALLTGLAAAAAASLLWPLRRLQRQRPRIIETLTREFDGRLETYADLPPKHPFRALLAEDALAIAQRHAPGAHISGAQLGVAGLALTLPLLALLWLGVAGPGLYRDGARALWAGWLVGSLLPAERIAVQPGDEAVRLGGSLTVRSYPLGFDPASAQLHARVGKGPWASVDMAHESHGFYFTFFSLHAPVSYYVSAAGVRSPTYTLSVVSVPGIAALRLVYRYPAWTQLPDHVQQGSGDIAAIAGTQVRIQLHATAALGAAELVLDGAPSAMQTYGQDAEAQLQVSRDARYYLATRIGSERVRLSDDFLIRRLAVPPPVVRVTWPARDYSASPIEEVTTDVQASDDYGLQELQLRYAVNGGAWHSVALAAHGTSASDQFVFPLESLRAQGVLADGGPATAGAMHALAPGDLVSYYAIARGHELTTPSDLYFIEVQPFDRRYSQSQAAGGEDAGEQQQIADRQRQILLSTWNLLHHRAQAGGATLPDNAAMLATLQSRLALQAEALAGRTQARELSADPKIARFVASMRRAAAAMRPAATRLAATQLDAAVAPEQQALQYLLQAQSQFTDVQLSLVRNASAAQSGRDLSQLYQLEMDLHKNQYESGQGATPQSADPQDEALERRLRQLAQRQQQLAEQMQPRAGLPAPEQRWQQQSLQREAEELRRELAQNQARSPSQSPGQSAGQSPGQSSSQPQGGSQSLPSGQSGPGAGALDGHTAGGGALGGGGVLASAGGTLTQRLDAAIEAMREASAALDTRAEGGREADAQAAARRAQQALGEAGTELAREHAEALQQAIAQLAGSAGELHQRQVDAARSLASMAAGDNLGQRALADQKRALSADVQRLGDEIAAAERAHRSDAPATAAALARARAQIEGAALAERLDIAAQALDAGAGRAVLPGESRVTQGLAEVQQR
ncbi:MAG TPA: hypothetical protein VKT19_08525, partial [Steroidobacteraceae bacterium]|nr:hypothetical protein [Steroidobacteraceae bacterium]